MQTVGGMRRGDEMILATAKVADFDQFIETFSTRGAEKRREHNSKGAKVFHDPDDANRIWVAFDWEQGDYEKFIADPEVPAIFQEAGLQGPPVSAPAAAEFDS
jgi:hypothetical protein